MPPENERRSRRRRRRRVSVRRSTSTSRRTRRGRPSMGLVDRRVADAHASRSVPSVLTCTTSTGTVPIRSSPAERTHRTEPDDGRSSRRRRRSPSTIRRSRGHGWTMAVPSYPRVLISFGSCTCGSRGCCYRVRTGTDRQASVWKLLLPLRFHLLPEPGTPINFTIYYCSILRGDER